jgi:general secretion pathway protein L
MDADAPMPPALPPAAPLPLPGSAPGEAPHAPPREAPAPPAAAVPVPPPGVAFLPTEAVLLLAVTLPRMAPAQRRAAAAFAVEDRIARPLETVHVVLGPPLSADSWLVAVVARAVLEARLEARPPGRRRLVPDALALPRPAAGEWSVLAAGGRVVVRTPDGAGFAAADAAFAAFHAAAGRPAIVLFGGAPPEGCAVARRAPLPAAPEPALARFDLTAGRRPGLAPALTAPLRRAAAIAAVAGAGHLGLAVADALALTRLREVRAAGFADALAMAGLPPATAPAAVLAAFDRAAAPAAAPALLPLLARGLAAMAGEAGRIGLRDLRFRAEGGSLAMTVEAPDLATLQRLETALAAAGIRVSAGTATAADGLAEQMFTLAGAGS